jgi:hypothetical protein
MATSPDQALSASSFLSSIGINVHMDYTDGAYASEPNVAADLAYLGIASVRDGLPTDTASIPVQNQITALNELAADGIKFDLVVTNTNVQTQIDAANALEASSPGSIIALEGPNEINNWPVTYDGLTGQAAANAFQKAFYTAVKSDPTLNYVSVYDYTGGATPIDTPYGKLTKNSNGSFNLVDGITGWLAILPVGITTITATYTGTAPFAGLFYSPGNGQESSLTTGANGKVTFTYDNKSTKPLQTYISIGDWQSTTTITGLSAVSGKSGNLVTFDPNMSLAGMATDSNTHPYPPRGAEPGSYITRSTGLPVPGPRVITEDGYNTDPKDANGVSQLVQAQGDVKILLDAYKAGVAKTFLYELLDEKSDPSDTSSQLHFGVFNSDNTPKLAAVAIHDLTTLLSIGDTAKSGFSPGKLAWSATGLPSTANTLLLEKTNGAFDLAVWNEPASASASPAAVAVALGATYGTVEVFDPVTGSAPIETLSNVSKIDLSLGLDPLVIEVEPAQKAAITPVAVSAASQMGFLAASTAGEPAVSWAGLSYATSVPVSAGAPAVVTTPGSAIDYLTSITPQPAASAPLDMLKAAHHAASFL